MISRERMAAVDRNAEALGVDRRVLMESSGNAIARVIRDRLAPGSHVTIVAGRGNNGGDGFVAARFLSEYHCEVYLVGRADTLSTDLARANYEALRASEIEVHELRDSSAIDLPDTDLLVDAMVGTGVAGALREPAASVAEAMNATDAEVLAVDVPSGVDANSGTAEGVSVEADHVVTFHDMKPGLESLDVPVTVAPIGIPDAARAFVGPGDVTSLERRPTSHKGDAGRILVVGGGPYAGAPSLTAIAALRTGADLATVACPSAVAETVQGYSPNLIVEALEGDRLRETHLEALEVPLERADCVVVGPGLGDAEETLAAVRGLLEAYEGRAVVDADALTAVPEADTEATIIGTPHQGELVEMGGPQAEDWRQRREAVEAFAAELGHTLLVKGHYDVISDGSDSRVSRTGNPGMTVGGTGDVLAGIVASLFARKPDALQAASVGAYLAGRAGDAAAVESGDALVATDVIDFIPATLSEVRE